MKYKYIEVIKGNTEIVKRVDVSKKTYHSINTIENGMNRNMNHEKFHTIVTCSNIALRVF
jgi:hypothetical protein